MSKRSTMINELIDFVNTFKIGQFITFQEISKVLYDSPTGNYNTITNLISQYNKNCHVNNAFLRRIKPHEIELGFVWSDGKKIKINKTDVAAIWFISSASDANNIVATQYRRNILNNTERLANVIEYAKNIEDPKHKASIKVKEELEETSTYCQAIKNLLTPVKITIEPKKQILKKLKFATAND